LRLPKSQFYPHLCWSNLVKSRVSWKWGVPPKGSFNGKSYYIKCMILGYPYFRKPHNYYTPTGLWLINIISSDVALRSLQFVQIIPIISYHVRKSQAALHGSLYPSIFRYNYISIHSNTLHDIPRKNCWLWSTQTIKYRFLLVNTPLLSTVGRIILNGQESMINTPRILSHNPNGQIPVLLAHVGSFYPYGWVNVGMGILLSLLPQWIIVGYIPFSLIEKSPWLVELPQLPQVFPLSDVDSKFYSCWFYPFSYLHYISSNYIPIK
jgi:hypothetical protein